MRTVILLGILLYSGGITGQEFTFISENGNIAVQGIKKQKDYRFVIRTFGGKLFELFGGNLYMHDRAEYAAIPMRPSGRNFNFYDNVKLENTRYEIVIPVRPNVYELDLSPGEINTKRLIAKKVDVLTDSVYISSDSDTVGVYSIARWSYSKVFLVASDSKINTLRIGHAVLNCVLISTFIDSLILSNVELNNGIEIQYSGLPKYIQIDKIACKREKCQMDLTQFVISDSNGICDLRVGKGVANLIKANYKYFSLVFDSATTVYDKERIYMEMMDMQKVNYFLDGYEKLDKEYKAFKYLSRNSFVARLQNRIDKYWWDYGYDKFMVIKNSIKVFLLFFVINLLAYKGLSKVYHPIKFKEFDERLEMSNVDIKHPIATSIKKYLKRIPVIFLYTAFVFWGLKLDLKELEIKKPIFMSLLIIQYVIGLICLAYIANYIISK